MVGRYARELGWEEQRSAIRAEVRRKATQDALDLMSQNRVKVIQDQLDQSSALSVLAAEVIERNRSTLTPRDLSHISEAMKKAGDMSMRAVGLDGPSLNALDGGKETPQGLISSQPIQPLPLAAPEASEASSSIEITPEIEEIF